MYNAFINKEYDVILINGNVQERRKSSFIKKQLPRKYRLLLY